MLDPHGEPHRFVRLFLNGDELGEGALATPVGPGDEIEVLAAIAGGLAPAVCFRVPTRRPAMSSGPTGDRLIRVDMTRQTVTTRALPRRVEAPRGRALSARILLSECDPKCDPLGPGQRPVMAPGVVSGTVAPTSGRISIGGKSPLTGGIKEANAGASRARTS